MICPIIIFKILIIFKICLWFDDQCQHEENGHKRYHVPNTSIWGHTVGPISGITSTTFQHTIGLIEVCNGLNFLVVTFTTGLAWNVILDCNILCYINLEHGLHHVPVRAGHAWIVGSSAFIVEISTGWSFVKHVTEDGWQIHWSGFGHGRNIFFSFNFCSLREK